MMQARTHADDIELLEEARKKFRSNAIAATKRGDMATAAENDRLSDMLRRVVNIYRQAGRIEPMAYTTAD